MFKLVRADVQRSERLRYGDSTIVWPKVEGLMLDPAVLGALKTLLDEADLRVVPALQKRLAQLLVFDAPAIDDAAVVDLVADSLVSRRNEAKRDDRSAAHLDAQELNAAIAASEASVRGAVRDEVAAGTAEVVGQLTGLGGGTTHAGAELSTSQERILAKLGSSSEAESGSLRQALAVGGAFRLAELVAEPQPWLQNASAAVWSALGELLQRDGKLPAAEEAFLRAAEHPGVTSRARQLVRAATVAELRADQQRADELIARARGLAGSDDQVDPAVLLHDARTAEDPQTALGILARIEPVDEDQRVGVELAIAQNELRLGDPESARAAVQRARSVQPDSDAVAEVSAVCVLLATQMRAQVDDAPDHAELLAAARLFEQMGDELVTQDRPATLGLVTARASLAYAFAGEERHAAVLLDGALADSATFAEPESAEALAQAALVLQRFDDVLLVTPDDREPSHVFARASAAIYRGRLEDLSSAAADLDGLLDGDDPEFVARVAFARLSAAAADPSLSWSDRAAAILEEQDRFALAMLRAERLRMEGHGAAARNVLLEFSDRTTALRQLIDLAVRDEDHSQALSLSSELLGRGGDAQDRLRHATLLAGDGDRAGARRELVALARDADQPSDARRIAYARAVHLSEDEGELGEVVRIAEEWAGRLDDDGARWQHMQALARRSDFSGALERWRAHEMTIPSERHALLLGTVLSFSGMPAEEMLRRLAELSDQFDRPERIEYQLITANLRIDPALRVELARELGQRVAEALESFPVRFPTSQLLRAFPYDEDDPVGSLARLVEGSIDARAQVFDELVSGIREGTTATCLLAATAGLGVGELSMRVVALPLGYSEEALTASERADAAAAVSGGGSTVWDPAALFVAGGLASAVGATLRRALPASAISQSALDDAARALATPGAERRGAFTRGPEGTLQPVEWTAQDVARDEERARGMLELARDLTPRPDRDPDTKDELDDLLASDLPVQTKTWPATLVVARRFSLAVYSDDRYVRLSARQLGLPAFGTLTLLEVLSERGLISAAQLADSRRRLARTGSWGLELAAHELLDLAREDDFEPTVGMYSALHDSARWRAHRLGMFEAVLGFLEGVHREAPDKLAAWVHRVIDAASEVIGSDYTVWGRMLIYLALNPVEEPPRISDAAFRALADAVRQMTWFRYFRPEEDLVIQAIGMLLQGLPDDRTRAHVFKRAVARLSPADHEAAYAKFVR